MIREIKYAIMLISLVLAQVLIFNQIQFSGYINPYVYILFILLLPLSSPPYATMILAFVLGFIVDVFSNSLGVHAAASVFIAAIRPFLVRVISIRDEDKSDYPGLQQYGFRWFLGYTSLMVFLHHLILFYVEVFSFNHFFLTLGRVLFSSLFSIFIIVLSQFLVFRK
ncbi:MAG: rod shape-determining protein MreD [Draconibacterium sp.]|nr:MAG: rod shape-determining protein MreD [Draconibacterium sp.]